MTQALEDLLEALEDVDDATREEAAKALAAIADPRSLDALISACADEYWSVRAHAGSALAKLGGPQVAEALIGLFNDPIMEVRNQAVEAAASRLVPGIGRPSPCDTRTVAAPPRRR